MPIRGRDALRRGRACALCLALIAPVAARGDAGCALNLRTVLPLREDGFYLTLPAMIGGRGLRLILDTGSEGSLITPEGVSRLSLAADPARRTQVLGADGAQRVTANAWIDALTLGVWSVGPLSWPVGVLPGGPRLDPPVLGLLGADVLSRSDVEIDLPHRRLRLWDVRVGSLVCRRPPAWTGGVRALDVTFDHGRIRLPFTLDGHSATAILDSGARSRIVSRAFALRAGVSAERLDAEPGGETAGVGLRVATYHWHRFATLEIGGEVTRGPTLTVAPISEDADMLLGADWLARHIVWVSYATGRLFLADAPPPPVSP